MPSKLHSFRKSLFFLIFAALILLLLFAVFNSSTSSAQDLSSDYNLHDDFSLYYRLSDIGCVEQQSEWFQASINERGAWRSDGNNNEIGCLELKLELKPNQKNADDFRVCVESAETISSEPIFGSYQVGGVGEAQCTPYASQAGGSAVVGTENGSSASAIRIWIETRETPAINKVITNFRFGANVGHYSPNEWGTAVWTSDIRSLNENNLSSISPAAFLDGDKIVLLRLNLSATVSDVDLVRVLKEDQAYIEERGSGPRMGVRLIDRNGVIACPAGTILQSTVHQDKGDNSIWWGSCYFAPYLFADGAEERDSTVEMNALGAESDHRMFGCRKDSVLVGFDHRGIDDGEYRGTSHSGDETALSLICREVKEGVLDYSDDILMRGPVGPGTSVEPKGPASIWIHGPYNGPSGCRGDTCFTTADGTGGFNDSWDKYNAWDVDPANMYAYTGVMYNYFDDMHIMAFHSTKIQPQYEWVAIPPGADPSNPFPENPACSDGIDNDGDGLIDFGEDPDCLSPEDDSEEDREEGDEEALNECVDGIDNDLDGYIDGDDPGCKDGGNRELDTISCGFSANPTVVAVGIGTSELSWDCRHLDGTVISPLLPALEITDSDSGKEFPGISGAKSREGSANVSPVRNTTFYLKVFNMNGGIMHQELAEVKISTTSFDEVIP